MQQVNKKIKNYKNLLQLYKTGADFTSIDTETSTNSISTGRIIELSAIRFNKDGIISSWTSLINPQQELSEFIINLTHINQNMVNEAPLIKDKINSFCDFIKDSIIVGHNIQYDMNFINAELANLKLNPVKNRIVDTLLFSRQLYPDFQHFTLEYLADAFKINKGSSHRALDDANTCYFLLLQMLKDYESKIIDSKKLNNCI